MTIPDPPPVRERSWTVSEENRFPHVRLVASNFPSE